MKKFLLLVLNMAAAMSLFAFSTGASAQIGSLAADLVYTPVTPCRVFDTRPSQGGSGPIASAGTKNFRIWGTANYAFQGGSPTNCGITAGSNTAAVALNLTVVTPAAGGFVTAYPFGATLPTAATVNFQAGDIARGNFSIAKVSQSGATDLSVYSSSNVHVVGDVVGFYSRPVATAIECNSVFSAVTDLLAGTNAAIFTPQCSAGYTMMSGGCYRASGSTTGYTNAFGFAITGSTHPSNPLAFYCGMNNSHATETSSVQAKALCCRIPGR